MPLSSCLLRPLCLTSSGLSPATSSGFPGGGGSRGRWGASHPSSISTCERLGVLGAEQSGQNPNTGPNEATFQDIRLQISKEERHKGCSLKQHVPRFVRSGWTYQWSLVSPGTVSQLETQGCVTGEGP